MSDLEDLASDLARAAVAGASAAGVAAVHAGAYEAEVGMRSAAKSASIATSGLGSLQARIGATHRRGVYQESAPAVAPGVNTGAIADTMAATAAAAGAHEVTR